MTNEKTSLLMCSPEHYGVEYVINPWMAEGRGHTEFREAREQWAALKTTFEHGLGVEILNIPPQPGLPDMVFTANAGLVIGDVFVPSRFRHAERSGEEAHFTNWAANAGMEIIHLPHGISFEGAGDALFDRQKPILWMGHGFRTDFAAAAALGKIVVPRGYGVEPLHLIDPRFYHLDTCFCPLNGGYVLYYPQAFSHESRIRIEDLIDPHQRIAVNADDALTFACNAVNVGRTVVMNGASDELRLELAERGFDVARTPLSEFLLAGGAAKCLTLRINEPMVH